MYSNRKPDCVRKRIDKDVGSDSPDFEKREIDQHGNVVIRYPDGSCKRCGDGMNGPTYYNEYGEETC